jgi:hypothetical protein
MTIDIHDLKVNCVLLAYLLLKCVLCIPPFILWIVLHWEYRLFVPISFSKKGFCYVLCTCWCFMGILIILYVLSCWYELNIWFTSSKCSKWTNGSWCLDEWPKCYEFFENGVWVDVMTMYMCYLSLNCIWTSDTY